MSRVHHRPRPRPRPRRLLPPAPRPMRQRQLRRLLLLVHVVRMRPPHLVALSLLLALAFGPRPARGTCQCNEVCSTYSDTNCWFIGSTDSACKTSYDTGGSNAEPSFVVQCPGVCYCNIVGCNCDPCYPPCPARRELALETENEAKEELFSNENDDNENDGCADYNEWTLGMAQEEKVRRLADKYCVDDDGDDNLDVYEAMPNILQLAEALVDLRVGDNDGSLTCEEFNKAYFDVVPTDLCRHVNSTPYCELDDSCNDDAAGEETTTTTSGANGNGPSLKSFAFCMFIGSLVVQAFLLVSESMCW